MHSRPEAPPDAASAPQQAAESERVARILARYGAENPLTPDRVPAMTEEVKAAIAELTAPAEPPPAARPAPPIDAAEAPLGIRRWQRLVLALLAAVLVALFWHRLTWLS